MNTQILIDWKFVVACGVAIGIVILANKTNNDDAGRVLAVIANSRRDYAIANSNR